MKTAIMASLSAVAAQFQSMMENNQIPPGGQAEINFKMAQTALYNAIEDFRNTPDTPPAPVTVVMNPEDIAASKAAFLDQFGAVNSRLNTISEALAKLLTPPPASTAPGA